MDFRKWDAKIQIRCMLLILFVVNLVWFSIFKFHTIMGDDLNSWIMFKQSNLDFWNYTFSQNFNDKYRPVFNAVEFVLFKMFGLNYVPYYYTNILVNFVILCVFFKIVNMITKNAYISFIFSLLFVTSRFAYYDITMLTGIMEAAALFLFLMAIYHGILFYKSNEMKHLYGVLFYYLLTVFTHERYLILVVCIASLILISKIEKKAKFATVTASVSVLLFNILVKKVAFHSSVMMGTSNESIKFNIPSIAKFVGSGILNMLGLNVGPQYLSGMTFHDSSLSIQIVSLLITIFVLVIVAFYLVNPNQNKRKYLALGMALLVVGSLIFVSSITIRQEFRWLFAPYVVVLIFIAYSLHSIRNNLMKYAILGVFALLTLRNDHYYRGHMYNTFFIYSQIISDTAYDETVNQYGQYLGDYTIFIEKNNNLNWPLLGDQLFKVYSGNDNIKVNYVDRLPDNKTARDIFLKLDWNTKKMINVGG